MVVIDTVRINNFYKNNIFYNELGINNGKIVKFASGLFAFGNAHRP